MAEKESYDKVLLTAGIILGVGIATYGVMSLSSLSETHQVDTRVMDKELVASPGIDAAKKLDAALNASYSLQPIIQPTQEYVGFVAPELWVDMKGKNKDPFDLVAGPPIHGDIPNKWFLDNGLRDEFVYSDVLTRDPDGDGFTVQEEYLAKTLPNDASSHPSLVDKLSLDGIERRMFKLTFSMVDGEDYTFKASNRHGQDIWKNVTKVNGQFGIAKNSKASPRFELVSVTAKQFPDPVGGGTTEGHEAVVKDLKPTKNGCTYTVRQGTKYPASIIDSKVKFTISAGTKSGESIVVEEGAEFQIPGDSTTTYILKTVDNKTQSVTIADKKSGVQKKISKTK